MNGRRRLLFRRPKLRLLGWRTAAHTAAPALPPVAASVPSLSPGPAPVPPAPVVGVRTPNSPRTAGAPASPLPARLNGRPSDGRSQDVLRFGQRREDRLAAAVLTPEMRAELVRLHSLVDQLQRQRRRLEGERDRWERLARELEAELRDREAAEREGDPGAEKFRRAKKILARLTHPDTSGASGLEAQIREQLFVEFWAEFERIEAERPR